MLGCLVLGIEAASGEQLPAITRFTGSATPLGSIAEMLKRCEREPLEPVGEAALDRQTAVVAPSGSSIRRLGPARRNCA